MLVPSANWSSSGSCDSVVKRTLIPLTSSLLFLALWWNTGAVVKYFRTCFHSAPSFSSQMCRLTLGWLEPLFQASELQEAVGADVGKAPQIELYLCSCPLTGTLQRPPLLPPACACTSVISLTLFVWNITNYSSVGCNLVWNDKSPLPTEEFQLSLWNVA